jgi:hypothetical protein
MERFGSLFGYHFLPHVIGHADRKARVERFFHYVENNFLAGRSFDDWHDLNRQARQWCVEQANRRNHRKLGMSPEAAFLMEKSRLRPLPPHLPPVFQTLHRKVDIEGYITVDTNRYSAPERLIGTTLDVHKQWDRIKLYHRRKVVADHPRVIGRRDCRCTDPAHHSARTRKEAKARRNEQEKALLGKHEILDQYVAALKKRKAGSSARQLRSLLHLYRTYDRNYFLQAIVQAFYYGLFDIKRLEQMILARVATHYFDGDNSEKKDP